MSFNNSIRAIGKKFPGSRYVESAFNYPIYNIYYKRKLKKINLAPENMLIIGTIARSGTHYIMLLLANYIAYKINNSKGFSPSEMNDLFPNNWHLSYVNYHNIPFGDFYSGTLNKPDQVIKNIGVDEVTRSHSIFQKIFWKDSKVLHLYRNPLDYSVSLYNYKHKKRPDRIDRKSSPHEVLQEKFENYVAMYKSYSYAAKSGKYYHLRIAYEELIRDPIFYLGSILRWLGNEPDQAGINFAVEMSSIKKTRELEDKGSVVNPTAKDLKGSFISSGQVGQWKDYFTEKEFSYWESEFKRAQIDIKSFILD